MDLGGFGRTTGAAWVRFGRSGISRKPRSRPPSQGKPESSEIALQHVHRRINSLVGIETAIKTVPGVIDHAHQDELRAPRLEPGMMGSDHLDHLSIVKIGLPPGMDLAMVPADLPETCLDHDLPDLLVEVSSLLTTSVRLGSKRASPRVATRACGEPSRITGRHDRRTGFRCRRINS